MKKMHDFAYEYRPSEEEQKDIRHAMGITTLLVMILLTVGLAFVIGPFALIVGPALAFGFGAWFYEWLKASAAENNYKRAKKREEEVA